MENIAPIQNTYKNGTKLIPHGHQPESESNVFASFLFDNDGLNIGDIIDTINPLHHIPVVSTLYQNITGDEIANGPQLIGATLTSGPIGFAGAALNITSEETTNKSIGNHVFDFFTDTNDDKTTITPLANASKLSPDEGTAALALLHSGDLEASVARANKTISATSHEATETPNINKNNIATITAAYSQKSLRLGINTQLADLKT